ncbi:MAG TPA: GGDEF domain-containing protein, partial [Acidobacteriota bacterium]|nr:GGDEF domain-containing protein [Acidobacteriota bacterium]
DIIARMGGDEFVVLAVDVGEGKADVLAQRLKEKFEARNAQPGQPLALSISVGVAHYDPESPGSIQDLITSADKRMYVDKEASRHPGSSRGQATDVRP